MYKPLIIAAALATSLAGVAAAEGDAAAGENDFKKCRACHSITTAEGEVIQKGGKTGPDLYGVVGRQAGSVEGFRYGDSLVAAGEAGLVWDVEHLVAFVTDPSAFLKDYLGDSGARAKMTFKLKEPENVIAYILSVGPEPMEAEEGEGGEAAEGESSSDGS